MTWRGALGVVAVAGVLAGCGVIPGVGGTAAGGEQQGGGKGQGAGEAEKSPRPAESAVAAPKEESGYTLPKSPCAVLDARTRASVGLRKAVKDKYDVACKWSNEPGTAPPYRFRDLKITYESGLLRTEGTEREAKLAYDRMRTSDYRQPSVFGGAPAVKGTIKQVGSVKEGQDYDEGYYVFYVYKVAEAGRGEGKAVLRKGNVIVTITASGANVPGRRVRDGKPIDNATAQAMIDKVADRALAAIG
ncbi:hypothetical protein ACIBG7_38570 [Nonomuraea sp. NPDC050328]|uniref:hypothetical protein n=1 Tax=Nonomuraea sp. NPDC050328 TaxID=3364361 RepID=UPI003799DFD0